MHGKRGGVVGEGHLPATALAKKKQEIVVASTYVNGPLNIDRAHIKGLVECAT